MSPETRAVVMYALSILAGAVAAGLGVLATQLAGTDPIEWRPIIAAAIGPVVAGLAASRLPQPERASLSVQADHLIASDVPIRHMIVADAGAKQAHDRATMHAVKAEEGVDVDPVDHSIEGREIGRG